MKTALKPVFTPLAQGLLLTNPEAILRDSLSCILLAFCVVAL
jgi:hypothetical protein